MHTSTQVFLHDLIDYAGLFPPAKLPMAESVREYAAQLASPQNAMLARFICPASRLDEFAAEAMQTQSGDPWRLSILATANEGQSAADAMRAAMTSLKAFMDAHPGRFVAESVECKVAPPEDLEDYATVIAETLAALDAHKPAPIRAFLEVPMTGRWQAEWATAAEAIAAANWDRMTTQGVASFAAGLKLRCGGVTADAFPTAAQIAYIINAARDAGVPMKFTAGLHHPLYHKDATLDVNMHGFLNVFGAGILAYIAGFDPPELEEVLRETSPKAFTFDERGFTWRDVTIDESDLRVAREKGVLSYGSCSFREPVEDLQSLGLLD